MVTPFDEHNELDLTKTTTLIEHLLNNGTDGIVVGGTTGESPTLTTEEKLTLYVHVVKEVYGRGPVIEGTGSNNTKYTIELTKKVEKIGVDGILLVTPYYNKPNQEGLYEHFIAIAKYSYLMMMLYNILVHLVVYIYFDTIVIFSFVSKLISNIIYN